MNPPPDKPAETSGQAGVKASAPAHYTALPRGMRDVDGAELTGIEYVRERFLAMAAAYDYAQVDPSPLEMLGVLEAKSGPAIRDEIYGFVDKGGRDVGLRFDFTMGLTRNIAADRSRPLPSKVCSFGGVFRYDEPQKARYRYFHQWDVEVYGNSNPSQDAEIIEFTSRLFDALPVPETTIRVSHRSITESYIRSIFGGGADAVPDMLRAADKIQKKAPDQIVSEFGAKGYDPAKVRSVIDFAGIRGSPDKVEPSLDADIAEHDSWAYLKEMVDSLRSVGVRNTQIDFGVVRGLDYYTGMVFEVFGGSEESALAGGGRYDLLPGAFGRDDIDAAGVAGGVERIIMAMNPADIPARPPPVSVMYANRTVFGHAAALASALRGSGIPARLDLAGRSLRKQMDSAGSSKMSLIVAPREMADGLLILRDMADGTERTIPYKETVDDPRRFIITP